MLQRTPEDPCPYSYPYATHILTPTPNLISIRIPSRSPAPSTPRRLQNPDDDSNPNPRAAAGPRIALRVARAAPAPALGQDHRRIRTAPDCRHYQPPEEPSHAAGDADGVSLSISVWNCAWQGETARAL